MKRITGVLFVMTVFTMTACKSTGPSTSDSSGGQVEAQAESPKSQETADGSAQTGQAKKSGESAAPADGVWVAIPDGSKQCESKTGRPLEEDARKLSKAGIKVLKSSKGSDGMMHVALCGAATGQINAYFIPASDRDRAIKSGFFPLPADAILNRRTEF